MTPETAGYLVIGLVLLVLAVVIVKKFGKLIMSALTVIGALTVAALVYAGYQAVTGADLAAVKLLWEVVK